MARVAVTGSSGKLGRHVVRDLVAAGWDVLGVDTEPGSVPGVPTVRTDLTDFGQVVSVLTGVGDRHAGLDAVVHLAAVPAPGLRPDEATFDNNIRCTYNVFSAARRAGIRNVVWASSETVLGLPFEEPPPYLPVDEEYHPRPNSAYSLCKTLEEEMAVQFCRWDPELKMVGLRFSNVMDEADYAVFRTFDADPGLRIWNLWAYIDGRDAAQAVRRGLEHGAAGADVFIIANGDSVMSRPSAELAAEYFPGVPVRRELAGTESLMSIEKARRVLGYEPRHSWRDSA
jgi:nucleoside-diphosphate-sugar epimerase